MNKLMLLFCLLFINCMNAQEGTWDLSFGTGATRSMYTAAGFHSQCPSYIYGIAQQPDGKILIGGSNEVRKYNSYSPYQVGSYVARLNYDGTNDTTFWGIDPGNFIPHFRGVAFLRNGPTRVNHIIPLSNGKIIIAGRNDNTSRLAVGRLQSDGLPDSTFGGVGLHLEPGVWSEPLVTDMGISLSGELLKDFLVGHDTSYFIMVGSRYRSGSGLVNGNYGILGKLLSNGQLDSTWGTNGSIKLRGEDLGYNDSYGFLPSSGTMLSDGKFLVVGNFYNPLSSTDGNPTKLCIIRFKQNGVIDSTFGTNGLKFFEHVSAAFTFSHTTIRYMPDHSILLASQYQTMSSYGEKGALMLKLNPDGSIHEDWEETGMRVLPISNYVFHAFTLVFQDNGKLVIAGNITPNEVGDTAASVYPDHYYGVCLRVNADFTLDNTFADEGLLVFTNFPAMPPSQIEVSKMHIMSDGKILIGGGFTKAQVSRINADSVINPIDPVDTNQLNTPIISVNTALFEIFPNPCNQSNLNINLINLKNDVEYEIVDIIGKIHQKGTIHSNNANPATIFINNSISNGIYVVNILKNGEKLSKKFVLQR